MCKFSHDDAAFSPTQLPFAGGLPGAMPLPAPNMPFMPMFGNMMFGINPVPGAAYDPNEAQLDMRPGGPRNGARPVPMTSRGQNGQNGDGYPATHHGELPVIQDLTPQRPREFSSAMEVPAPSSHLDGSQQDVHMVALPSGPSAGANGSTGPIQPLPPLVRPSRGGNASFRGRGRGGRGTFTGDHHSFNAEHSHRDSKTIVVEKIPEEHLSLEAVNSWFKRFGTVTNVAVDTSGGKALVSFSSHEEAQAAWKAEEAVFNNRFVKIFWHRPMEGQGAVGARILQASAPLVANMAARDTTTTSSNVKDTAKPTLTAATTITAPPRAKSSSSEVSALAAKQQLLEKKIAEQKELMGRLAKATPEEKKTIMARLRKLDEMAIPQIAPSATPTTQAAGKAASSVQDDRERRAKELLDMELDIHAKTLGVDDSAPTKPSEAEDTTESLQEKLAKLRAEVSYMHSIMVFICQAQLGVSGKCSRHR